MDLEIKITTNTLPEREINQQQRTDYIVSEIKKLRVFRTFKFEEGKNNIWIILVSGDFKVF